MQLIVISGILQYRQGNICCEMIVGQAHNQGGNRASVRPKFSTTTSYTHFPPSENISCLRPCRVQAAH